MEREAGREVERWRGQTGLSVLHYGPVNLTLVVLGQLDDLNVVGDVGAQPRRGHRDGQAHAGVFVHTYIKGGIHRFIVVWP